tara:strand:+ start:4209 stop:4385 length:177 start_codon:yes stop_codon:yes gene_type:complete
MGFSTFFFAPAKGIPQISYNSFTLLSKFLQKRDFSMLLIGLDAGFLACKTTLILLGNA